MPDLILRKIMLRGDGKNDSEVEFLRGINLITGGSDTGKTYMFDLINYVLGASNPPHYIKVSEGYNLALLEIEINQHTQTLIRAFDETEFVYIYHSKITEITEKDVPQKYQADTKAKQSISKYLMGLLGYSEPIVLKSTVKGKTQQLSFRLLMKNFSISAEKITAKSKSIIETELTYPKPVFTVEKLRFLLSGEGKCTKSRNSQAVKARAINKLEVLNELLVEAEDRLNAERKSVEDAKISVVDDNDIKNVSDKISALEKEKEKNQSRITDLKDNIFDLQHSLTNTRETIRRFQMLKEQYQTEIERLEFVYEGESYIAQIENDVCPLCHSEIIKAKIDIEKVFEAFNIEKRKIVEKKSGIDEAVNDVQNNEEYLLHQIKAIEDEMFSVENYLRNEICPTIVQKQINYNVLNDYCRHKAKEEVLKSQYENIKKRIDTFTNITEENDDAPVKRDETVFENRIEELCEHMAELLVEFKFSDKVEINYDHQDQDFYINEQKRKAYGQGYSGLIYISYVLALKWIADKYEIATPNFLILDSPFTALTEEDEKKGKVILKSNKRIDSFFNYIIKEYENKQIILIENTDERYNKVDDKVNYIHFTKNKELGRYGFVENEM